MKRLLELALLTVALYGHVYALDAKFTYECDDEIAADVDAAIAKWNAPISERFAATRVDRNPDIRIKLVARISGGFKGWTEIENGVTVIQIVRDCQHRDAVVLHEFGHAFGLKHSRNRDSIMFHTAKDDATLSAEDEREIRMRWGRK